MLATGGMAQAASLAPRGCPISHCTSGATGVIGQALAESVPFVSSNRGIGSLHAEGCSGNGSRLLCLFVRDKSPAARKGTLKALDATTLRPLWGSAAAANSYDLDPTTAAIGQVPVVFSDSTLTAGDAFVQVHYSAAGAMLGKLSLSGAGTNFGLRLLSGKLGVVSQGNGVLTLVNLVSWQNIGSLVLQDPQTQTPVNLVGPAAASPNALYVVGYSSAIGHGILFSIVVDPDTQQLKVRSTFSYTGQSGAAPVVVDPASSGMSDYLVLLHVPGLIEDATPQNRLLGLLESPSGLVQGWAIGLAAPLAVSPTVDSASQSLFYESGSYVRQCSLISGAPLQTFNLKEIGGFPASFRLNGHLVASNAGGAFTLLLGGGVTLPKSASGEFVMAFQPLAAPDSLLWKQKIADEIAGYTGAWNFSAASQPGAMCPIAISVNGLQSVITRLCDH